MRNVEAQRLDRDARNKRCREENDVSDPENQIKFISQAELRTVRPVNKEAVRILYALDAWIAANQPDWRMSFEVSMGYIARVGRADTFQQIDVIHKQPFFAEASKGILLRLLRSGQVLRSS